MMRLFRKMALAAFAALLPIAAQSAQSPWTYVANANTPGNSIKIYVRSGMIHTDPKDKTHAIAWVMYDNTAPQTFGMSAYKSEVDLQNFDCGQQKFATLSKNLYDGNMGMGKGIFGASAQGSPSYEYPPPDTLEYAAMQAACSAIGHPI